MTTRQTTQQQFFFIHVMKTAGGTLRQHMRANFGRGEVWPFDIFDQRDLKQANIRLDFLTSLPAERRAEIRVYTGHYPFVAVEMLAEELTTITLLREPVERTLSYLRALKRDNPDHHESSLEEMYEDPFFFPCFIKDHQAKLFALTVEDRPESYMDTLEVDAERLAIAKANLERVDVIGLQDRFDEMLAELRRRFGWRAAEAPNRNVGPPGEAPAPLRRRIAEDNPAEMEFYEHARQVYERRHGAARAR